MHQRRHGHPSVPPGGDVTVDSSSPPTSATTNIKKRRKRVSGRKPKSFKVQVLRILQDEDALITLIQAISVIILMACGITLMLHFFGEPSDFVEDDESQKKKQQAFEQAATSPSVFRSIWSALTFFMPRTGGGGFLPQKRHRMSNGLYPRMDLNPSKIYQIPNSLSFVGDKSDHYAELRKEFDAKMTNDELEEVEQQYEFEAMPMTDDTASDDHVLPEPYDIYNCPEHPPKHYPFDWNLLKLLHHWEPDDPAVPEDGKVYQGLCVFDYEKDYDKAINYRRKEVPFVVVNDPQVQETVKRWNAPTYVERMLGSVKHRAEYSESNHFMYWNKPPGQRNRRQKRNEVGHVRQNQDNPLVQPGTDEKLKDWKEPTTMMRMTYKDWLFHANLTASGEVVGPDDPHYYFRLIGCGETGPEGECDNGSSEYLFDELPFFQPKESLYVVDPMEQKGIHCRFGMNGVISENHFDQSRNSIVVLGGERRYILAHPSQCKFMRLYPKGHPSARHSMVDWSDPDLDTYPEFVEARANEVVLQAGDLLYLPTDWFHYIISLNLNFQCNTRSGVTPEYLGALRKCGF